VTYAPPRSGRHHLHVCLAALGRLTADGRESIVPALRRAASLMQRRGLLVILSDFYEEDATLVEVRRLARMGHDVVVIHVLSRDELDLPRGAAAEFEDLESGATLVTNPDAVRVDYREAVAAFLQHVQTSVEREGLDYLRLIAGEPLEPALRRFLVGRRGGE
jgi:uncharacterized protein (DUF58 family)